MNANRLMTVIAFCAAASGFDACQKGEVGSPEQNSIAEAEAKSTRGAKPTWLQDTDRPDLFKRVRDRAYGYCLSGTKLDAKCASEQDDAVESSVMALMVAADQAKMKDKSRLGTKENYVATNPTVAARVENTCWRLYKEHGAADARILSTCLGNLTDYSPLIQLPVP